VQAPCRPLGDRAPQHSSGPSPSGQGPAHGRSPDPLLSRTWARGHLSLEFGFTEKQANADRHCPRAATHRAAFLVGPVREAREGPPLPGQRAGALREAERAAGRHVRVLLQPAGSDVTGPAPERAALVPPRAQAPPLFGAPPSF
jgi:hypothetical protein